MAEYKLGYYDTIAGLSALECSQKVSLTEKQLEELVAVDAEERQKRDNIDESLQVKDKKRIPIHGYLGKIDTTAAANANHDLKHTLLGGHVPRAQLEILSSTDFAHYFHKVLDCEKALEVYDHFINQNQSRGGTHGTPTPPASVTPSTPIPFGDVQIQDMHRKPKESDGVKKVILCKRCKARFSGPRRFTNMKKHMCMRG
ncbi:LAFE_0D03136g1_1 [Lachancea fermentati]|uniref:LAFE_0D03136g1_1 n=1 Tax=Lachancea fermentati TaxID=4955 RepID=A0A1G4MAW2_LACFM|nr:LAFE_0D03136g1_1 [Lachancea fermentati]